MAQESKSVFQIGLVPLCGEFELLAEPHLIRVQTIKKKLVEQMPETPLETLANNGDKLFRVVGRVGKYVVFHSDSQQFSIIHRFDWVSYSIGSLIRATRKDGEVNANEVNKRANRMFDKIPQLFEE